MKRTRIPLLKWLPVCLALSMVVGFAGTAVAQETGSLSYKAVSKWNLITPTEKWNTVSGQVGIPHANGNGFTAEPDGHALAIDTSGNGKTNHKVKGVSGFAVLKAKDAKGKKFSYALRFKKAGAGWQYSSSGVMKGKIKGQTIRLVDLNNNGLWNEVGTDGMIVGKGSAASFLSKVVNLGGNLFNFQVTENGRNMTISPFEGETGILNLRKGFKSQGQLVAAIANSESGSFSFNLASAKNGMKIPAGDYTIASGFAKRGGATVKMRAGRMQAIKLAADQTVNFEWGAKLRAEFSYARNGEKITIEPSTLKYFGKSGVEFFAWAPDVKSPKFIVKDKKSGKELSSGRFGGC